MGVSTQGFEVAFGFGGDDAAEQDEGDEVGESHEAVHDVGKIPDQGNGGHGTNENGDDPEPAIVGDGFEAEEVFDGFLAVVGPAEDGGKDKGEQTPGEDEGAKVGEIRKGSMAKFGLGQVFHLPIPGADDDQSGQGADDDGVPEDAGGGDQALADGILGFGGGGDDGSAAQAGFIGK